jgi:hypothetical protein
VIPSVGRLRACRDESIEYAVASDAYYVDEISGPEIRKLNSHSDARER